jgi:hypothetical protein
MSSISINEDPTKPGMTVTPSARRASKADSLPVIRVLCFLWSTVVLRVSATQQNGLPYSLLTDPLDWGKEESVVSAALNIINNANEIFASITHPMTVGRALALVRTPQPSMAPGFGNIVAFQDGQPPWLIGLRRIEYSAASRTPDAWKCGNNLLRVVTEQPIRNICCIRRVEKN